MLFIRYDEFKLRNAIHPSRLLPTPGEYLVYPLYDQFTTSFTYRSIATNKKVCIS